MKKLWKVTVNNWGWSSPKTFYAESKEEAKAIFDKYPAADNVKYAGSFSDEKAAELLGLEEDEEEEEIVLQISRIDIKTETFCTPWNGELYCVDICEDAEKRSAWLYNVNYGVKSLMFGELINSDTRERFLDSVFSNLPEYIEYYADEYEDD